MLFLSQLVFSRVINLFLQPWETDTPSYLVRERTLMISAPVPNFNYFFETYIILQWSSWTPVGQCVTEQGEWGSKYSGKGVGYFQLFFWGSSRVGVQWRVHSTSTVGWGDVRAWGTLRPTSQSLPPMIDSHIDVLVWSSIPFPFFCFGKLCFPTWSGPGNSLTIVPAPQSRSGMWLNPGHSVDPLGVGVLRVTWRHC